MLPIIPWGGSILGMIISLKNNARPRRKAFETQKENPRYKPFKHKSLQYNKVSAEKLVEVKQKIQLNIRRDERMLYLKMAIGAIFICSLIFLGYKANMKKNLRIHENNNEIRKHNEVVRELNAAAKEANNFKLFVDQGIHDLRLGYYQSAHKNFASACEIYPDEYRANLGLAASKVYICLQSGDSCMAAEQFLGKTLDKFGLREDLIRLEETFEDKRPIHKSK